jgi:hypothetical protein
MTDMALLVSGAQKKSPDKGRAEKANHRTRDPTATLLSGEAKAEGAPTLLSRDVLSETAMRPLRSRNRLNATADKHATSAQPRGDRTFRAAPSTRGPGWRTRDTSAEKWSAGNTMFCIVCLDARVVLNAVIVLDQLGRGAIGQVGRHMIKNSGLKVPDPHEDLEIRDC